MAQCLVNLDSAAFMEPYTEQSGQQPSAWLEDMLMITPLQSLLIISLAARCVLKKLPLKFVSAIF